jgi:hypothetical protein
MSKSRLLADLETNNKGEVLTTALSKINLDYVVNLKNESIGYLDIPTGTESQAPVNAKDGSIRFNSDDSLLEYFANKKWNFVTTEKRAWWKALDVKTNTNVNVNIYFCGLVNKTVDLDINSVIIKANIVDNKATVQLTPQVTNKPAGTTVNVVVKDGTDIIDNLHFGVIA